ncbi:hypothetical protein ACRYJJ_05990 [Cylindrospermopsis raciborskii G7]|uniref:hypothetical protein n=1 Tax=Cylindrospermopsis raciborskii TaxID=77022 RepID=UPI003EB74A8C
MDNLSRIINKVLCGDIRDVASSIPDNYIQAIVTSPPYFGHRNYSGNEASVREIGREGNLLNYVKNVIDCFEALKPLTG